MADSSRFIIRTDDIRVCRFFFHYIRNNIPQSQSFFFDYNNPDTSLSCRIINNVLELYFPVSHEREIFIRSMELTLSTTILDEKNFTWFSNDPRATYWLWGTVKLNPDCNKRINTELNNNVTSWYKELRLAQEPVSHLGRLTNLVAFIDYLCINTNNTAAIRRWLMESLSIWRKEAINLPRFKWLRPEDSETCIWAYRSLKKYQQIHSSEIKTPLSPVQIPSPVNSEETFHTFYALLDLWNIDNEIRMMVIGKLNKAFYQKSFRRKQAALKGREEISEEHQERLAFLVKYFRSDKASVIEMLIDDRVKGIETTIQAKQVKYQ